jgi:hypothetical protein
MTDTVTIPAEVAKRMARWFRSTAEAIEDEDYLAWADLLDPKPPTLRERVADAIDEACGCNIESHRTARAAAALAVVREAVAAEHMKAGVERRETVWCEGYDDAMLDVLRLLDGAES